MPAHILSYSYDLKRLHYFSTSEYKEKSSLREHLELYHDYLYPQYLLHEFVSRLLSFVFPGKYKIGDVVSIEKSTKAAAPYLLETFPKYFSGEFIITETPRTLAQYKMYKLHPLNPSANWESLHVSQDLIDRV